MKNLRELLAFSFCISALLGGCVKEGTVTDIEGNVYRTVFIGGDEWMAENLKTARYRTDEPIPNVTDSAEWAALTTGAWAYFENDAAHDADYGKLYNWLAITDSKGVCPEGWHVPDDSEWDALLGKLGGSSIAGCALKERGSDHWETPNECATNSSGFTAVPGGYRDLQGFINLGRHGVYWTSVEDNDDRAWFRSIHYNNGMVLRLFTSKNNELSVRCVRDK